MTRHPRLAALALALACLAAGVAAAAERPRLGLSNHSWPPYHMDDAQSPGLAREILDVCVPAAGFEPRYFPLPIEQMFAELRKGVLDGHVLSYDPARESFLVYGREPLFSDAYRPVVRAGSGVTIDSLDDFATLRLGHLSGLRYTDTFYRYVRGRVDAGTAVEADSNEELVRLLLARRIDVFVNTVSTVRWVAHEMGATDRIAVLPWDVKRSDYFLAVSKAAAELPEPRTFLDAFDACLRGLKADGRYLALRRKYHLE